MEAMGISGSITTWSKSPGKVRASIELAALGKIERGAVDGIAWEYSPMMGPRLMDGSERDFMLLESDLGWSADWRVHYEDVECTGEKEVNGVDCYLLSLTFKGEYEMEMAVNKETYLPATMDMTMEVQGNKIPIEIIYDSYGTFGDLTLPTKVTQNVLANTVSVTFDAYEFNVDIPDERFALPDEVKAILPAESDENNDETPEDAEKEDDDESVSDATDSDA